MNKLKQWFECKAKYVKTDEDGKEKKVSEAYLVDAVSYGDAEKRIAIELGSFIQGVFMIDSLSRSNIAEIVPSNDENDDRWYKAKITILDRDELTGKEKRVNQYSLIAAKDIDTALDYANKSFATYIVPFEVVEVKDTNIVDVFPYTEVVIAFNHLIYYEPNTKVSYDGKVVLLEDGGNYTVEEIQELCR